MQKWITIGYWSLSVLLVALIVCSLGYSFTDAILIGTMFLPGALAAKYLLPKISFNKKKEGIRNTILVSAAILVAEFLLIISAEMLIESIRDKFDYGLDTPDILVNPAFIAAIITLLTLGDYFISKYLATNHPEPESCITFNSERKKVSLYPHEIFYIESCDTEVWLYAAENRKFRNKTGISQWAALLGKDFIRIHRSYLVNKSAISSVGNESLFVGDTELPISRKYGKSLKSGLSG
ncbi:MAG: LytTR family transcriptional regulator [Bacteroidales bacterium]|jgi:hypothetical protein|nr:LytTR family transcriptional regulator [Bacteroidales bacterium]